MSTNDSTVIESFVCCIILNETNRKWLLSQEESKKGKHRPGRFTTEKEKAQRISEPLCDTVLDNTDYLDKVPWVDPANTNDTTSYAPVSSMVQHRP